MSRQSGTHLTFRCNRVGCVPAWTASLGCACLCLRHSRRDSTHFCNHTSISLAIFELLRTSRHFLKTPHPGFSCQWAWLRPSWEFVCAAPKLPCQSYLDRAVIASYTLQAGPARLATLWPFQGILTTPPHSQRRSCDALGHPDFQGRALFDWSFLVQIAVLLQFVRLLSCTWKSLMGRKSRVSGYSRDATRQDSCHPARAHSPLSYPL